jgi:hypothetical protein
MMTKKKIFFFRFLAFRVGACASCATTRRQSAKGRFARAPQARRADGGPNERKAAKGKKTKKSSSFLSLCDASSLDATHSSLRFVREPKLSCARVCVIDHRSTYKFVLTFSQKSLRHSTTSLCHPLSPSLSRITLALFFVRSHQKNLCQV